MYSQTNIDKFNEHPTFDNGCIERFFNSNKENFNKQPIFNIGMLGSVSDGKSTCVQGTTGTKTQRHRSEQTNNITIKQGYANIIIWFNPDTKKYYSTNGDAKNHIVDGVECQLIHQLSFIDCPGHQDLIRIMMGCINLMHGVIVVVAANDPIDKKPQLIQHLAAIEKAGITDVIVCLNKLDLITKEQSLEKYSDLKKLLQRYNIKPKAIIPVSFSRGLNTEEVLKSIIKNFSFVPETNDGPPIFMATRSFNINKQGIPFNEVQGGVIGGSLINGTLKVGDIIEIKPGICKKGRNFPFTTKITSLKSDNTSLDRILPGGLIGIGTELDPYFCSDDQMSGQIIGLAGTLPEVVNSITLNYTIVNDFGCNWNPKVDDSVYLQIGTNSIESKVTQFDDRTMTFNLSKAACIVGGSNIMISYKEDSIIKIAAIGSVILE